MKKEINRSCYNCVFYRPKDRSIEHNFYDIHFYCEIHARYSDKDCPYPRPCEDHTTYEEHCENQSDFIMCMYLIIIILAIIIILPFVLFN